MPKIVPRWEWRTFGEGFGAADAQFAALTATLIEESDELYLLSENGDASVKVRDGLMDVKHRKQLSDDGLELWTPVLKSAFPLSAADVASVLRALNAPVPVLERESYGLVDFEAALIDPVPALRVARVHKRRAHYSIDDCMVERTEMTADGRDIRTIAVESPDPELVRATRRHLELDGFPNVNVATGLKALLRFGSQRYAVIDVGTNSVKFHIGERDAAGTWHTIVDRADVTRLGEGLDESGLLGEEAIRRTVDAIDLMIDEARRERVSETVIVGTAGLRLAPNRSAFVGALRDRTSLTIDVISGEEEGRLAYLAATSALPVGSGSLVVFDSGGGSSQFTFGRGLHIEERFSVNVGAVRFAERFGLGGVVSEDGLQAARDAMAADLDRLDGRPTPDAVVAMGGTATNLAAVKLGLERYDPDVVHGTVLDLAEIARQIERFRTLDSAARRKVIGLQPNRAEVILAGACIVYTILVELGQDSVTVCDRGLRHGLLVERFTPSRAAAE